MNVHQCLNAEYKSTWFFFLLRKGKCIVYDGFAFVWFSVWDAFRYKILVDVIRLLNELFHCLSFITMSETFMHKEKKKKTIMFP